MDFSYTGIAALFVEQNANLMQPNTIGPETPQTPNSFYKRDGTSLSNGSTTAQLLQALGDSGLADVAASTLVDKPAGGTSFQDQSAVVALTAVLVAHGLKVSPEALSEQKKSDDAHKKERDEQSVTHANEMKVAAVKAAAAAINAIKVEIRMLAQQLASATTPWEAFWIQMTIQQVMGAVMKLGGGAEGGSGGDASGTSTMSGAQGNTNADESANVQGGENPDEGGQAAEMRSGNGDDFTHDFKSAFKEAAPELNVDLQTLSSAASEKYDEMMEQRKERDMAKTMFGVPPPE